MDRVVTHGVATRGRQRMSTGHARCHTPENLGAPLPNPENLGATL